MLKRKILEEFPKILERLSRGAALNLIALHDRRRPTKEDKMKPTLLNSCFTWLFAVIVNTLLLGSR